MNASKRRLVLAAALLATLLAAYLAPRDGADREISAPARPQRQTVAKARPAAAAPDVDAEVLEILPRAEDELPDTVFAVPRPVQPPPQAPAPAPVVAPSAPAPPQAPPPPFQVFGRAIEDGKVTLFLRWGERNILARVGDTVEGQYRLESEDGRTLQVRYLTLDQLQSLTISAGM